MFKPWFILLILLPLGILSSCKSDEKKYYSIREYNAELRPILYNIVNTGILTYDTAYYYIKNQTSDKDLIKLSQCEHPLIRAHALILMLKRQSFDQEKLINEHLGDTAVITVDWGEFGIGYQQVSDLVLEKGEWEDSTAKAKTINLVITRHNQLIAAYNILGELKPEPSYYPMIREMVERTYYQGGEEYGKIGFADYKHNIKACYALAAYKKTEDIPLIKKLLEKHMWQWTDDAFGLMKLYPNDQYLDLLERYYDRHFYRRICNDHYSFEHTTWFIETVAVYKNSRSAALLSAILNKRPMISCRPIILDADKELTHDIYNAVHKNRSDVYKSIQPAAEKYLDSLSGEQITIRMGDGIDPDKKVRKIRW